MIESKRQMYELLRRGALGNSFRIWESTEAFEASGFRGLTGVRCSNRPGAPYYHHLTPHQALIMAGLVTERGLTPVIYEASPDEHIVCQGEITRTTMGLYFLCSTAKTHMRAALKTAEQLVGLRALEYLRSVLSAPSFDDVTELLDCYPDHVIELTIYDCFVGAARGRNYACWEVRGGY